MIKTSNRLVDMILDKAGSKEQANGHRRTL